MKRIKLTVLIAVVFTRFVRCRSTRTKKKRKTKTEKKIKKRERKFARLLTRTDVNRQMKSTIAETACLLLKITPFAAFHGWIGSLENHTSLHFNLIVSIINGDNVPGKTIKRERIKNRKSLLIKRNTGLPSVWKFLREKFSTRDGSTRAANCSRRIV